MLTIQELEQLIDLVESAEVLTDERAQMIERLAEIRDDLDNMQAASIRAATRQTLNFICE